MRKFTLLSGLALMAALWVGCSSEQQKTSEDTSGKKYVLVIHGGAGTILKKNMTPEKEAAYTKGLTESLQAGYDVIKAGGSSLDAVEAAIHVMEESPLFNAGKGAVFTHDGRNELDAAIMYGKDLSAGAVAGVTTIKSPITAARAVMEKSEHVMLAREGAEAFAQKVGLEMVDPKYFWTQRRWDGLQKVLKRDSAKTELDHDQQANIPWTEPLDEKFGTVGCVALDQAGNISAGTSTGGMTNKMYGRVGDAPIIGAGTYANNKTAGISCTGWGEFYMRAVAAHQVSSLMELKGLSLQEATQAVIDQIGEMGGDGGMIALDAKGNVSMPFNTAGMYRGTVQEDGTIEVKFYE